MCRQHRPGGTVTTRCESAIESGSSHRGGPACLLKPAGAYINKYLIYLLAAVRSWYKKRSSQFPTSYNSFSFSTFLCSLPQHEISIARRSGMHLFPIHNSGHMVSCPVSRELVVVNGRREFLFVRRFPSPKNKKRNCMVNLFGNEPIG